MKYYSVFNVIFQLLHPAIIVERHCIHNSSHKKNRNFAFNIWMFFLWKLQIFSLKMVSGAEWKQKNDDEEHNEVCVSYELDLNESRAHT